MSALLSIIYLFTQSYGTSIILLSILVNILMIPLYWYAEKMQQRERTIQAAMRPKILEYKSVFKGNELFLYTQNLYKQHNYHPVFAFRSLIGLLIQLPFFIAAYSFLSNLPAIEGVSYLFFNNLGSPDKLISLFGLKINLMPFVMTIINLSSVIAYGKGLNRSEKYPIYMISFLFLILLYNSPTGLLLYWSMNNLFTLCKSTIFKKIFVIPTAEINTN